MTPITIVADATPFVLQQLAAWVKIDFNVDSTSGHPEVESTNADVLDENETLLAEIDLASVDDVYSLADAVKTAKLALNRLNLDFSYDEEELENPITFNLEILR